MKTIHLLTFAAFFAASRGSEAAPSHRAPRCTSIGGTISASLIAGEGGQTAVGNVTGTLRGAVSGVVAAPEVQPDGSLLLNVIDHFVTEAGDVLETQATVHLVPVPGREGSFHHAATYQVVSGAGAFARASGSFLGHGEADVVRGQVTVRYEGSLCGVAP